MQYTITAVDTKVRDYQTKFGDMKSYSVQIADPSGVKEICELSQKSTTPAPTIGQALEGSVEEGQYGRKFKKEYNAQAFSSNSGGGNRPAGGNYTPRDDSHIKAQWAIGQAVTVATALNTDGKLKLNEIEDMAKQLFAMVDRVKTSLEGIELVAKVDEVFPVNQTSLDDPFAGLDVV